MKTISDAAAREIEEFYRNRAVTPGGTLGETTGSLQPGSVCFVVGPLIERSRLISRLVADAAAAGAETVYASAHRRATRLAQEVAVSAAAGPPGAQPGLFGVTDQPSSFSQALLDIGPRLSLVAVDDGTVLRAPEPATQESEGPLHGWQRWTRLRQLAVVAGSAVLPPNVESSMLVEDLVICVTRLRLQDGDLDFRVTVSGARRPPEHLVAQELPDRLRVERVC